MKNNLQRNIELAIKVYICIVLSIPMVSIVGKNINDYRVALKSKQTELKFVQDLQYKLRKELRELHGFKSHTLSQSKNVVVGLLDTGVDGSNPLFYRNIKKPKDGVVNLVNPTDQRIFDSHGHGSHVGGIILALSHNVKLMPVNYYSLQNSMDSSIKALRTLVENNVDIINYSGGGEKPDKEELEILLEAERKGILVIVAAGNDGRTTEPNYSYYPAMYGLKNIIVVGNQEKSGEKHRSSNYGRFVDFMQIGVDVPSLCNYFDVGDLSLCNLSGTSQATPVITAMAVAVKQMNPNMRAEEIKNVLISSRIPRSNRWSKYGNLDFNSVIKVASLQSTSNPGLIGLTKEFIFEGNTGASSRSVARD